MIDINLLRENPDVVKDAAKNKNSNLTESDIDELIKLDDKRRTLQEKTDSLRHQRNEQASKLKSGKPSSDDIEAGKKIKDKISAVDDELKTIEVKYLNILKQIPNIPLDDVPVGKSEEDNVVSKTVGDKTEFEFEPKNHWELAEATGWIDKERAAQVTGARFAYIKGNLVKLQFALMQYGLNVLTDEDQLKQIAKTAKLDVSTKAFTPVLPPLMIREQVFDAMDRLEPREDRYKIEGHDLWLQGSAEHVLGPMHMDEILDEDDLPVHYVGYATSFREEAGSYGKDLEGILRMHQFDKLEMETLTTADQGLDEHKFLVAIQEYLMQQLGLPYQVLIKCTADIGKPNASGVDIEAWLPGQDKYRETHTADYMTDYQARRLKTRVRRKDGKLELVHTNDATAFAQRPLIAIMENYQTKDGKVKIPEVLQPYFGSDFL